MCALRVKYAFLLVDVSNTFTKFAVSNGRSVAGVQSLPTRSLTAVRLRELTDGLAFGATIVSSVVPARNAAIRRALHSPVLFLTPDAPLGIEIEYPDPGSIGADRLANAIACVAMYGTPAIVVDFGTAVTFDVISARKAYLGGVIAPGLNAMTEYLHSRTALLPRIALREPLGAVGKSTEEAMLSGAVHGYRGLVKEIVTQIRKEAFPRRRPAIVATGGDAGLISQGLKLFDVVDPKLTLHGLRVLGLKHFGHNA